MASIQHKMSRGHKYWYIVESRRVNGKPRPVVLEYLGKAETLLRRLQGLGDSIKVKSYAHGLAAALLKLSDSLDIVSIINKYVQPQRPYFSKKPIRNHLTVGCTLLFAAVGRVCHPTSKQKWRRWAKSTSLPYMLRISLNKVDSQHFWDMMDCLPVEAIERIETELLQKVRRTVTVETGTLLYDATNFFTYIDTTNERCRVARRGSNKQKRNDLRQVGLAMVVTREDLMPLFHMCYEGNMHDSKVFKSVVKKIKQRLLDLDLDISQHTVVFDRGNNSKANMKIVKDLELFYTGALTPVNHRRLISDAEGNYEETPVGDQTLFVYRDKRQIWDEERTVLVFVSRNLKQGQLRGMYASIEKKKKALDELKMSLLSPKARKRTRKELTDKITNLVKGQFLTGVFCWELKKRRNGPYVLDYWIDRKKLEEVEESLGIRILMTNRHDWDSASIIKSYYGQSAVEHAFKNIKNHHHLGITPGFHWTDQKIHVHFFTGVLGYLLATIIWKIVKEKSNFRGSLDSLLETLNSVRLAAVLEETGKKGRPRAIHKLEQMSKQEEMIMRALGLMELHRKPVKLKGVGVYNKVPPK